MCGTQGSRHAASSELDRLEETARELAESANAQLSLLTRGRPTSHFILVRRVFEQRYIELRQAATRRGANHADHTEYETPAGNITGG